MKLNIFLFLILSSFFASAQKITEVKGYAPNMIGKELEIFQINDYLSYKEERLASTTVKADSTFSCSFYIDETRKLLVKSNNNVGTLFASPGETYEVVLPDRDPYSPYRPAGNKVQLIFLNSDSTDINYKIIGFNRMVDNFVAKYYTKNNADTIYYVKRLDWFRNLVDSMYHGDTLDRYFAYHRKFSFARLDDMRFYQSRSKYEKFDFYLKYTPVYEQNEAYMDYVNKYYDDFLSTLYVKTNEEVYMGILKSSPTEIMRALGHDHAMEHNIKLRELVMIKMLGDIYYDKDYPQSNIRTILDSLRNKSLFKTNAKTAGAIYDRLTDLYVGGKAPEFNILYNNELLNLKKYSGKHLYLIFMDPTNSNAVSELNLLVPLHKEYSANVRFLTVLIGEENESNKALIKNYPWEGLIVNEKSELVTKYKVVTKPSYILLDGYGYVVGAPALGPKPNGNRQTIESVFFGIKKASNE